MPTEVCILPADPGPCRGYFARFYYDAANGQCMEFSFGGCRGNRNNFNDIQECNRVCNSGGEFL